MIGSACGLKVTKTDEIKSNLVQQEEMKYDHSLLMNYAITQIDKAKSTTNVEWKIKNLGSSKFPATGWTIFFNQIALNVNEASLQNTFKIENVKGDFQKLKPTDAFKGLAVGDSITLKFQLNSLVLRKSFLPLKPYLVYDDGAINQNIKLTYTPFDENIYKDFDVPTPKSRYEANKELSLLNKADLIPIIPTPVSYQKKDNTIILKDSIFIGYDEIFEQEVNYLKAQINNIFEGKILVSKATEQNLDADFLIKNSNRETYEPETYEIKADENIVLQAQHSAGMFYAVQSLLQVIKAANKLPSKQIEINAFTIKDKPQFSYRGLMIDVSRNFHSKETLLEIINQMAYYKLNKLHLHLTDDEGWRIEIEGLPELTDVGAKRGHTIDESENVFPFYASGATVKDSYGTGYFSKAEFIEILKHANKHHIEVIPEIDLPGHIRAGIVAMRARYYHYKKLGDMAKAEEYLLEDFDDESIYSSAQGYNDNAMCVCKESAFTFIEKVVDELANMYKEADVPFNVFHSGGDEVAYGAWQKSPVCQKFIAENNNLDNTDDLHAYTLKRLKKILAMHNLTSAGWEEIVLKHTKAGHQGTEIDTNFVQENVRPYVWNAVWGWGREDMTYKLANLGFKVVMCNSAQLYLDMAYNTDPNETGLSWSGFTNTKSPYDLVPYNIYKTAKVDDYENFVKEKVQLTESGKENLLGIQGQVWSETLTDQSALYYMLFPKLFTLAERAWSTPLAWEVASHNEILKKQLPYWNEFANRLGQVHLPQLEDDITYRIPLPGAVIEMDTLYANVVFPGLINKYTMDGTEPNEGSATYEKPVFVNSEVIKLKTFSENGRFSRTSVLTRE